MEYGRFMSNESILELDVFQAVTNIAQQHFNDLGGRAAAWYGE